MKLSMSWIILGFILISTCARSQNRFSAKLSGMHLGSHSGMQFEFSMEKKNNVLSMGFFNSIEKFNRTPRLFERSSSGPLLKSQFSLFLSIGRSLFRFGKNGEVQARIGPAYMWNRRNDQRVTYHGRGFFGFPSTTNETLYHSQQGWAVFSECFIKFIQKDEVGLGLQFSSIYNENYFAPSVMINMTVDFFD